MFWLDSVLNIGSKLIDKLIPDPEQKAKAQLELAKLAQEGKLADLQADMAEMKAISERWQADMASDSWLAKNVRPLSLCFVFGAYFFFAFMSMLGYETRGAYVELLGEWGMLIMTAYFGGRSLEKVMDLREKAKVRQAELKDAK